MNGPCPSFARKKELNESMNMFSIAEILLIPLVLWIITGNGLTVYAILRLMPAKTCNVTTRRKRFTFLYLLSSAVADFLIGALIAPMGLYQGEVPLYFNLLVCYDVHESVYI